jgi:AcrR family transcriptional regulator
MDRRREILNAAQVVFDIKGYAASTVQEIALKANISKGSIYNYFGSKEDLFAAVFAEALAADHSIVDGIVSSNVPAFEKLQGLLDQVFQRLESFTRSGRLIMELWAVAAKKAELADAMAQIHAYWRGRIRTVLEDGVQSGEFGTHFDPGVASSLIWATLNGIIVQALFDSEAEVGEHSLSSLKRGLLVALTAWSETSA